MIRYHGTMLRVKIANPYEYELPFPELKGAALAVLQGEGVRAGSVTLAFVDSPHIHRLNKQFLDHDEPTDVLTFPYSEPKAKKLEAEIVMGYQVAQEQATERGHALTAELILYVIHGCLHLCGYDDIAPQDARTMRERERHYLAQVGQPDIADRSEDGA
jgi:probable rRNA maturation factor